MGGECSEKKERVLVRQMGSVYVGRKTYHGELGRLVSIFHDDVDWLAESVVLGYRRSQGGRDVGDVSQCGATYCPLILFIRFANKVALT